MRNQELTVYLSRLISDRAFLLRRFLREVRKRGNPKAIHRARVELRRFRESVSLAVKLDPRAAPLVKRSKKLLRALSPLRTQDALLALLEGLSPNEEAKKPLRRVLRKNRKREARRAFTMLTRPRIRRLLRRAERLAKALPDLQGGPTYTPRALASEALAPRLRELFDHLSALPPAPDTASLHRARILVKRLRYTLELVGTLLPTALPKDLPKQLEELQSKGGHFHDLELLSQAADVLQEKASAHEEIALLIQKIAKLAESARGEFLAGLGLLRGSGLEAELFSLLDPALTSVE